MSNQSPTIRVIANWNSDGSFKQWNMSHNPTGPGEGPGSYKQVKILQGNTGTITFQVVNGKGITFAANNPQGSSPILIQPGTTKPVSGVDQQFQGFTTGTAPNGEPQLVVPDSNTAAGKYIYQLNFNGAPSLDPIVDNGGPGKSMDWAVIALGIALLAAVVYFFAFPMFTRNRSSR